MIYDLWQMIIISIGKKDYRLAVTGQKYFELYQILVLSTIGVWELLLSPQKSPQKNELSLTIDLHV